jgi:thiol-disulfide isomerase/thioredoxin
MFDKEKITIDDITSKGQPINEYIEGEEAYIKTRDNYQPDREKMKEISEILEKSGDKLTIKAFGAKWCGDCKIQLPHIAKIINHLGTEKAEAEVFSRIMTISPWLRKNAEFIWKVPPSPPETIEKKFDMHHIPAIFLFNSEGKCIGKIDEKPEKTENLEGDILHYLNEIY